MVPIKTNLKNVQELEAQIKTLQLALAKSEQKVKKEKLKTRSLEVLIEIAQEDHLLPMDTLKKNKPSGCKKA